MIGAAVVVALLAAPALGALGAQGRWEEEDDDRDRPITSRARRDEPRRLFTWRGLVDDDTRIHIRAANVESRVVSGTDFGRRSQVDRDYPLPRRPGTLRVQLTQGRGRVHVIQQPNAENNFTAIVRVKDAQSGADQYRFSAYFEPADDWRTDTGRGWDEAGAEVGPGDRVFQWSGRVDGDLRIVLRRNGVGYTAVSGDFPRGVSMRGGTELPMRDGRLDVSLREGRGSVVVVQQPTSYNNYTAIIRVVDQSRGFGYYDFDLIWR